VLTSLKALIRRFRIRLAKRLVGGDLKSILPRPQLKIVARVINPGDPEWVPAPTFVPPLADGWKMPPDWDWSPELGWRRKVDRRNSDGC
jgi:hypothetical protein